MAKINPYAAIQRISFEMSNQCQYSRVHTRCAVHFQHGKPPQWIPIDVYRHVLESLATNDCAPMIGFSIYNEPTSDPRLFMNIQLAKQTVPNIKIFIWSNGYILNQTMINELLAAGVDRLNVTGYTPQEYDRLKTLSRINLVKRFELDRRFEHYDRDPIDMRAQCGAPYSHMAIWRTGEVGLCVHDWDRRIILGDLNTQSLDEILYNQRALNIHDSLMRGDRSILPICRRCTITAMCRAAIPMEE
jgi:radical SAM protein with 4Fe4S-binding SPASM domain